MDLNAKVEVLGLVREALRSCCWFNRGTQQLLVMLEGDPSAWSWGWSGGNWEESRNIPAVGLEGLGQ